MLSKEKISSLIKNPVEVLVYDTVTSTNDIAKDLCKKTEKCILVAAEGQTNGRGRQGKNFFSPKGSGLYFSIVFNSDSPAFELTGITCAVGVACARAIKKLTSLDAKIKWVNDIYIDDKKVCGILVQSVSERGIVKKLVIGVGINVSTIDFPEDIKSIAASLGREVDRNILAAEITNNISDLIFEDPAKYICEYKELSNVIGKDIKYLKDNLWHEAHAVDIDGKGGLVVLESGEQITLTSGEITVRFPLK